MNDDPHPTDERPIRPPLGDVLDLHTFQPRDLAPLLDDYLCACVRTGIPVVRIVHGKGRGILRARVQQVLRRHPRVVAFQSAPPEDGGWGATLVRLLPASEGDLAIDCPEA